MLVAGKPVAIEAFAKKRDDTFFAKHLHVQYSAQQTKVTLQIQETPVQWDVFLKRKLRKGSTSRNA